MRTINNVVGIINLVENSRLLQEFTENRPLATVPFGGRYRLIDFVLSGMTNSGITDIGILTSHQHRSLLDHLRTHGYGNVKDDIILLPPSCQKASMNVESEVHNLYDNLDFLQKSPQESVIIASADIVGNLDFRHLLQSHHKTAADITLLYKQEDPAEQDCLHCVLIDVGPDGLVTGIRTNPVVIDSNNFFLGTFILRKDILVNLLEKCVADKHADTILEGIISNLNRLKIYACHYSDYLARIHCVNSYYRHNMALLNPETWHQLFRQSRPIYTKIKNEAPTRYGQQAKVNNALLAGGCKIEGTLEQSVLFRNVTVGKGAYIKNSILMPNTHVAEGAHLEYVICDKDVRIHSGNILQGQKERPIILKKGAVV